MLGWIGYIQAMWGIQHLTLPIWRWNVRTSKLGSQNFMLYVVKFHKKIKYQKVQFCFFFWKDTFSSSSLFYTLCLFWLFDCLNLCRKVVSKKTDEIWPDEFQFFFSLLNDTFMFFCCIRLVQQLSTSPLTARLSHFLCARVTGNFFSTSYLFSTAKRCS